MVAFPFMLIAGISGVLTPDQGLPNWLEYIADIFPLAWMARGTRDAFAGHLHLPRLDLHPGEHGVAGRGIATGCSPDARDGP